MLSAELEHLCEAWGKLSDEEKAQLNELALDWVALSVVDKRQLTLKARVMKLIKSRVVVLGVGAAAAAVLILAVTQSWQAALGGLAVGIVIGFLLSLSS